MALILPSAMCRLCLQSESEASTVSIFSIANGHVIAEIVQCCLGIAIVKNSSPYENVCSPCIVSLVSMYELYLKYQECNQTFLQMRLETDHKNLQNGSLCETVVRNDVRAVSPSSVALEDIIEEDNSISDESEELESSSNTLPLKGPADANYDEPVYYLQDFAGYVRQAGEMDGLLHTQHQHEHTDESQWNHPDGPLNKSLMEELNAQVARLDGQEITCSKVAIDGDATEPSSSTPQPTEMYHDRAFLKGCHAEETPGNQSKIHTEPCQDAPTQNVDCYRDPKHQCYICETSFQNDIELVNHFPAHFLDVPQDCSLCGTQHRTVMNLNRHMAYHQPGRPFKCNNCERRFADPQTYKWHVSEFHSRQQTKTPVPVGTMDGSSQPLLCDICGKSYVLAEPYEQHVLQHELGHQQYQCKQCDRGFTRNIYLLFHLETHAKKRPHRCQNCSMPFASLYLKNFHEKRHPTDEGPVSRRCPLCLTVCRAKHRLLAHIEAFHPADSRIQLLQCSFNDCRLKFLDLSEFQSHITDHRVGDRFPCTCCPRIFKKQRLLFTHLRTVHGQIVEEKDAKRDRTARTRPTLRCEECSKTFRSERTFRLHHELSHGYGTLREDASS